MDSLHPSRSHALTQPDSGETGHISTKRSTRGDKPRKLTVEEKMAIAEARRKEAEQAQKEREKKIKLREKKKRDLRKMTSKGQPVMKTRLEDLLGKVKKVMKDS